MGFETGYPGTLFITILFYKGIPGIQTNLPLVEILRLSFDAQKILYNGVLDGKMGNPYKMESCLPKKGSEMKSDDTKLSR